MTTLNATICTALNPAWSDILARLVEPFDAASVQWKPGATAGNRAMALPYLNASAIQERLDAVLGTAWEAHYEFLAGGAVLCLLRLKIGDEWHERCDVGQCTKGEENGTKGGVSDSFKRAARCWGVGRYLTRVPRQWVGYDPQKRRFTEEPKLPPWALSANVPKAAIAAAKPPAEPVIYAQDLVDTDPVPAVRIDDAQEQGLARLLRDSKADVKGFLSFFGIKAVSQLPQQQYPQAKRMLESKLAGNGKAAKK